ncbi:MAG: hypothetical protein NTV66_02575 [Methylococcales bacterium]|nr:hypothetical protein [Methylococcales bacterium]
MNLDVIKEILLYCLAFNYGMLVIWFGLLFSGLPTILYIVCTVGGLFYR